MEANSSEPPIPPARRSTKRLLFDRRYGWIYDEWTDPAAEALAGGRGMFCILPIAKAMFKIASQAINNATGSMARTLENHNQLHHQVSSTNPSSWSQKLTLSPQRVDLKLLTQQRDHSVD